MGIIEEEGPIPKGDCEALVNRFITGLNILLVIFVAIGSFVLSYSALSDLASKNGFAEWRAYVLPLVIDVGMLAFGLAVVHAHLHGTNPLRRRLLNLTYIIATTSFNILHAPNNLLAQTLAALPPVTLFFTFEVLMAMIEHNIKQRQGEAATLEITEEAIEEELEEASITVVNTSIKACPGCLKEFSSPQGYAGHLRYCEVYKSKQAAIEPVNGHGVTGNGQA